MIKKIGQTLIILLVTAMSVYGQQIVRADKQESAKIYFRQSSSSIDEGFGGNREILEQFTSTLLRINSDTSLIIEKLRIEASASPEGYNYVNVELARRRAEALWAYVSAKTGLSPKVVERVNLGVDWVKLREMVAQSDMQYKNEVLHVIDNVTVAQGRNKQLMDLKWGRPYLYMMEHFFPELRNANYMTVYYRLTPEAQKRLDQQNTSATQSQSKSSEQPVVQIQVQPEPRITEQEQEELLMPRFAVKTNLAMWGIGVSNIGFESALGGRFTIDIPLIYSPYTIRNDYSIRVLALQPELRFWLRSPFSGHFFGLHAHGAYYNIALNDRDRFQDKDGTSPLWGYGLSYGYAADLSKRWGLEFTIGGGYASYRYDMFYNVDNGALFDSKAKAYWGITRVGINLTYKFNYR